MSNTQIVIPDNNLPICVQRYQFKFLNDTGNVTWTTSCAVPSNIPFKRVWNFNLSGNIIKSSNKHILIGDFSKVVTEGYSITFEGPIQGTIIIQNQILDANKYMKYEYDSDKKIMTWTITNLCKTGLFEMNLFINDNTANCSGCKTGGIPNIDGVYCYQFFGNAYASPCKDNSSQCCCQGSGSDASCVNCYSSVPVGTEINCSCTECAVPPP